MVADGVIYNSMNECVRKDILRRNRAEIKFR
jgi:hypothetical protein